MLRACSNIYLKLENVQPSGSFKSRGVGNFVLQHLLRLSEHATETGGQNNIERPRKIPEDVLRSTHFFCSSGGNAGLGCVHAAVTLGCPATIVVPLSTSDYVVSKLKDAGAKNVIQKGASWAEANAFLTDELLPEAKKARDNPVYVPPFDHPDIWTGHSTIVDEIMEQLEAVDDHYPTMRRSSSNSRDSADSLDAIICSVGGGGLFSGIMQGLQTDDRKKIRVLAVETGGANSLAQAVQAKKLITLPAITSIATTLGARTVCKRAFDYVIEEKARVSNAVLSDAETVEACRRFADEERILVEPACGVSLAVAYSGKLRKYLPDLQPESRVVIVVCGGSGMSLDIMAKYVKDFC